MAYIHTRGFLHGAVTSENIALLTDSIDAPFAKLTGFGKSRRFDGTLTSHPGIDVYDICAVLIEMLAKNKQEPPLLLPTFDPIVKNGMSNDIELRPSAVSLVGLLEGAFDADETEPDQSWTRPRTDKSSSLCERAMGTCCATNAG